MVGSTKPLLFVVNHIFLPPQLPQADDLDEQNEHALCQNVYVAAQDFSEALPADEWHLWEPVLKFLEQFSTSRRGLALSEEAVIDSMKNATSGDVLVFLIRAQNAGIIIRKEPKLVVFESFEVSPPNNDVMAAKGRLLCSFPGPAVQIPSQVLEDPRFQAEMAKFLVAMDANSLDSAPITTKAKSGVTEVRDTAHPRYITQLLTEILRGMGDAADVPRITKRIADDILWSDAYMPWRRSATWLVLRVALQTTLVRQSEGHQRYKMFMAFLHARILLLGLQSDLPSHLLDCMRKKTARRLNKLGPSAPSFLVQPVIGVIEQAKELLQQRWTAEQVMQATSLSSTWAPGTLNILADTALSLHSSREYLKRSLQGAPSGKSSQHFNPHHFRRLHGVDNFSKSVANSLVTLVDANDNLIALADFERAVLTDLEGWATENLLSSEGCVCIARWIEQYWDVASKAYSSDPELLSTMLLTLFRMWVELDRMAVAQCPLLANFSPEVPKSLLHPLLLRTSESIDALDQVETYLRARHFLAVSGQSVLAHTISQASFAVQYFEMSSDLQALKVGIDEAAAVQRAKKVEELGNSRARYNNLMNQAANLACTFTNKSDGKNGWKTVHKPKKCAKCKLQNQASGMSINVHEWPLPRDPLEAKIVVFEAAPPLPFVTWRRITYMLLRDVCTHGKQAFSKEASHMELQKYPALQRFQSKASHASQVVLSSTTKSFNQSHYKAQRVSAATDQSICLNHGLQWKLFDNKKKEWVTQQVANCTINDYCTFQLPPGRYKNLQYAVSGTSHTSNEIMANQTDCSTELTLHEYIAFAKIRSGPRLQWLNIISELRSGSLSFQDEAVYTLLRQAAWQMGPLATDGVREWHIELAEKVFGEVLLGELGDLLLRLRANRRNVIGMQLIAALISRLLASATDRTVVERGFKLMRDVRRVTYEWLNEIVATQAGIEDEDRMQECRMQVCEIAATCRRTYDVDIDKAAALLCDANDITVFIHCAILVNHSAPTSIPKANVHLCNLLRQDCRLSHMVEPLLSRQIAQHRDGLDQAILQIWKFYRPSSTWEHLPWPNNRWLVTRTAPYGIQKSQAVQLDLLSGQLLIDGKPLGRLPKDIISHPTYRRIFGQITMDVIPADMPGMDFKTSSRVGSTPGDHTSGYQVFFALLAPSSANDSSRLVIRAQQDDTILELIPHHVFKKDLPAILVKGKTHWLNVSMPKGEIEVRDLETRWNSSPNNWRIHFSPYGRSTMRMSPSNSSDTLRLIDPRSVTMAMISAQLQPLEDSESLIVTRSDSSGQLAVSLPRLRLEFVLNDDSEPSLESLNIPGMIIDANQSCGTMIGLKSQLVLCAKESPSSSFRQVIIPYSPDSHFVISPSYHHSNATLSTGDQHVIRYFKYTINPILGRLEGDGSMLSKLYKIYLHAITSHCLPDKLMGCTGTEEALQELRSAGVLSFQRLGEDERQMLQQICALSPTRTFYPSHLKVMQKVGWSKQVIIPLAQHTDFRVLTQSIWQYAETLGMFSTSKSEEVLIDSRQTSDHLLDRAAHHNGVLYRDQIHAPGLTPSNQHDTVYHSRGNSTNTENGDQCAVFNVSAMIFSWETRLSTDKQLYASLKRWGSISGVQKGISLGLECNVAASFLSACNSCRTCSKEKDRYRMMFSFCAWAYTTVAIRPLIPTILAFATSPRLRVLIPPSWSSYDLSAGFEPTDQKISDGIILKCASRSEPSAKSRSSRVEIERERALFNQQRSLEVKELINILKSQWPSKAPKVPHSRAWLFDVQQLESKAAVVFETWFRNRDLFDYIQKVQQILNEVWSSTPTRPVKSYKFSPSSSKPRSNFNHLSLHQLFTERDPPVTPSELIPLVCSFRLTKRTNAHNTEKLRALLVEFRKSTFLSRQGERPASIQEQYADDLEQSLQSLETESEAATHHGGLLESQALDFVDGHYNQSKEHLQATYDFIRKSLLPLTEGQNALSSAGLWPRLSVKSLLSALAFDTGVVPSKQWRKTLNCLAQALLTFQRAFRLRKYFYDGNMEEFSSELKHSVAEAGDEDEEQLSIRLLIQVDGNFLARPIQLDFMKEMITPLSRKNTALQLNMGEGKSSVIVPMAAAELSDGHKLVRVVVLKQLASSMFQLLVHRLGGLANRRVFYLPFSRSPQLTLHQTQQVQAMFLLCVQKRGVLVVQPEHILSFKLMGLDRKFNHTSSSTDRAVANHLLESQRWLSRNSRDILDESDEILHVRYQLTYTVGKQQSLQGSPDRWTIVQQTLMLVSKHAQTVRDAFSDGIEFVNECSGSYPRIRVLQEEAGRELVRLIAQDISSGAIEQCSFDLFPPHLRSLALTYITKLNVTSEGLHIQLLEDYCKKSEFWNTLLILRGLLAHGILQFVLKEKRWRVDYGLDLSRSLLAVPYRAKDVPSLRAEFSHPDVAILLTCLSYYWQGLSETQVDQCVVLLFKQDNPVLQYDKWVLNTQSIPEKLKHLSAINVHDPDQRAVLHHLFHQNQAVIDFFLSHVVFPRDAKEFPKKMATSGWDLAEHKRYVTTGFSGTKDGGYLLPTSIDQADPLLQSSTNAKVLTYLLQPENGYYQCIYQSGEKDSERSFLHRLSNQKPKIRVLLDVGAQILKLSNSEVAAEWLSSNSDHDDVLAIVYFGLDDEPYVRTRTGVIEALVSSPFRQQLDRCLVYLDDMHTRGTDFKLPLGTRAAVTLGPKVTKDRLLQGCMRMRKLGYGHSVMFFAPPEVDHSIRTAARLQENEMIEVEDILLWTMLESCMEVVHRISHWAQQGIDHRRRELAWIEFNKSPNTSVNQLELAWIRDEARSLDEMYAIRAGLITAQSHELEEHPDIARIYRQWARSSFSNIRTEEEEEREVIAEIEIERQVQRPPKVIAATPHVHPDVRILVQTGVFRPYSPAFVLLFQPLARSFLEEQSWSTPYLSSTRDFTTVTSSRYGDSSDYLRPVNWILSAPQSTSTIFVVLSPYEVNELLPDIRRSKNVHLHQYAPRVTQAMKSFEDLAFHCIPPLTTSWVGPDLEVTTRLNIWAGQLYLKDEGAYQYFCNFLGLYSWQPSEIDIIQPDGFIKPEHRRDCLVTSTFVRSPVPYLKSLFASRRKGMDYSPTHVGKIFRGRLLREEDFHQA